MTPAVHPALQRYERRELHVLVALVEQQPAAVGRRRRADDLAVLDPPRGLSELLHAGERRPLERPVRGERSRRLAADVDRHGGRCNGGQDEYCDLSRHGCSLAWCQRAADYCFGSAKAIYPCGPVGVAGALPVPPPSAPPTSPGPVGGDMNTTYCRPFAFDTWSGCRSTGPRSFPSTGPCRSRHRRRAPSRPCRSGTAARSSSRPCRFALRRRPCRADRRPSRRDRPSRDRRRWAPAT